MLCKPRLRALAIPLANLVKSTGTYQKFKRPGHQSQVHRCHPPALPLSALRRQRIRGRPHQLRRCHPRGRRRGHPRRLTPKRASHRWPIRNPTVMLPLPSLLLNPAEARSASDPAWVRMSLMLKACVSFGSSRSKTLGYEKGLRGFKRSLRLPLLLISISISDYASFLIHELRRKKEKKEREKKN